MALILNSIAVDLHLLKIIILVFIEKQDTKDRCSMIPFLLIVKNHQSVMYILWNHSYIERTQAHVGRYASREELEEEVEWSLVLLVMTYFCKRDLKQIC